MQISGESCQITCNTPILLSIYCAICLFNAFLLRRLIYNIINSQYIAIMWRFSRQLSYAGLRDYRPLSIFIIDGYKPPGADINISTGCDKDD